MIDSEKLTKFIQELDNYLAQISELQKIDKKVFLSDWKVYDLVDRKLHLILETFLSIGEMLISECGLRKPDKYTDIPKILYENNVIQKDLSEKLVDLAKFRNVLVHEYLYLDHERVYEHLLNDPGIIREFLKQVKEFVKRKP